MDHDVFQLPSHVRHFVTPWTAAHQASLSLTISPSCSSSGPLHWWCHQSISSSDTLFSFCLQSFPASGTFPISQLFESREGNGNPLQCLAWKIPGTGEPGGLPSMGWLGVRHDWATSLYFFTFMHWRRKWHPTPVSCLENPRDGGAWWAAVYGVAQSRAWLSRSSSSSSSCLSQMTRILELQLQHRSFQGVFRVISLEFDCFEFLAVQGTLRGP